jgi:hypothetical protein
MDGKNVADFVDPDIAEKLEALEREEEKLEAEGFYESDHYIVRFFCIFFCARDTHLRHNYRQTQRMNGKS